MALSRVCVAMRWIAFEQVMDDNYDRLLASPGVLLPMKADVAAFTCHCCPQACPVTDVQVKATAANHEFVST